MGNKNEEGEFAEFGRVDGKHGDVVRNLLNQLNEKQLLN